MRITFKVCHHNFSLGKFSWVTLHSQDEMYYWNQYCQQKRLVLPTIQLQIENSPVYTDCVHCVQPHIHHFCGLSKLNNGRLKKTTTVAKSLNLRQLWHNVKEESVKNTNWHGFQSVWRIQLVVKIPAAVCRAQWVTQCTWHQCEEDPAAGITHQISPTEIQI